MGSLDGKVALVTGASRGIGVAIARRFAADGARVALTARTTKAGQSPFAGTIHETVEMIEKAGGEAVAFAADLSRPEERARLIEGVRDRLGSPDILVNNAAVTYFLETATFPRRRYDLMMEVQVAAPVDLAQRCIPAMRARGAGWILNISSTASYHPKGPPFDRGEMGGTVYGMCKAAIERFSTGLAAELCEDGIAVNALSPSGLVVTPGVRHHRLDQMVPKSEHEPPEIMAEAALALCSGDPKRLTGRITLSQPLLDELARKPAPL
jgi:citronellol/citronellal dehydrogenase